MMEALVALACILLMIVAIMVTSIAHDVDCIRIILEKPVKKEGQ
jgi:hypothetical protein